MNPEKLAKLQSSVRIGGKGTPRRKMKKVTKATATDDKKLQAALQKLHVNPVAGVEEVNMFKEDGNVIHFSNPRVQAAAGSNTFAIYGRSEEKDLTELLPGILAQMGPESLASLQKLAEAYQNAAAAQGGANAENDDDEVPELVENFEAVSTEDTDKGKGKEVE